MSVVAVAVLLLALLMLLIGTRQLRIGAAIVAITFGLVLGSTPAGPMVNQALTDGGAWLWAKVTSL